MPWDLLTKIPRFNGCTIFHFVNSLLWHSIPQFTNIKLLCFLLLQIIFPCINSYLGMTAYSREWIYRKNCWVLYTNKFHLATCKLLSRVIIQTSPTTNSMCEFLFVHVIKILDASNFFHSFKVYSSMVFSIFTVAHPSDNQY